MSEAFFSATWYRAAQLRPLLHTHIDVHRHRYRGTTWYVLHDHATGRVHRFTPAAYLLIGQMNGERTLDEIWKSATIQLEENAPSQDEAMQLLSQLHSSDLMQADGAPETSELLERLSRRRWAQLGKTIKNPLAISISLWDPDRMLTWMVSRLRFLSAGFIALLWLAVVLPAMVLFILHWQEWSENLPERVLAAENILLLFIVFPLVKFLHELGHGLAVKAYGGAVHDAGVMLLIFMPVPYIDASASVSFRSKYRRALVGAGGMLVEMLIAALAVYVWLAAESGIVRAAALDVILVAGLSTLVVNGNPLLQFDGYFILTDLLEIPNLGGRSNRFWAMMVERRLFGVKPARANSILPSERSWMVAYAPLAYVYRIICIHRYRDVCGHRVSGHRHCDRGVVVLSQFRHAHREDRSASSGVALAEGSARARNRCFGHFDAGGCVGDPVCTGAAGDDQRGCGLAAGGCAGSRGHQQFRSKA